MQLTWFGHSAFRLDLPGASVLIDPFFTGNPAFEGDAAAAAKDVSHIVVTHGHGDHVGDSLAIAAANNATVITNYDLCMHLASKGLKAFQPMNTGGTVDLGAFSVTLTRADHSAGMGEAGVTVPVGSANGAIVKAPGEKTLWHMGDTDIFSDMALLAEHPRRRDLHLPDRRPLHHERQDGGAGDDPLRQAEDRDPQPLRLVPDHRQGCVRLRRRAEGQRHRGAGAGEGQGGDGLSVVPSLRGAQRRSNPGRFDDPPGLPASLATTHADQ